MAKDLNPDENLDYVYISSEYKREVEINGRKFLREEGWRYGPLNAHPHAPDTVKSARIIAAKENRKITDMGAVIK